jgi:nicotinamidase-related amidase
MTTHQPKSSTALIVVDVQQSFKHRPYWSDDDASSFLAAQNALIAGFKKHGLPVVRVFHVEESGAFSHACGYVRPLDGLADFDADCTIEKQVHSALAGTALAQWLISNHVQRIAVSGIRTEQCCETTTRHASDMGFEVDYVSEATLTFTMKHPISGRVFTPHEIKERTELVLHGRFANVCSVAGALERAGSSTF